MIAKTECHQPRIEQRTSSRSKSERTHCGTNWGIRFSVWGQLHLSKSNVALRFKLAQSTLHAVVSCRTLCELSDPTARARSAAPVRRRRWTRCHRSWWTTRRRRCPCWTCSARRSCAGGRSSSSTSGKCTSARDARGRE